MHSDSLNHRHLAPHNFGIDRSHASEFDLPGSVLCALPVILDVRALRGVDLDS